MQSDGSYVIIKVNSFQGHILEAAYRINYKKDDVARFFEIVKTDPKMKDYFLANFLLVEKMKAGQMVCYPTGWESINAMNNKEIKETCQMIVKGEMRPAHFK